MCSLRRTLAHVFLDPLYTETISPLHADYFWTSQKQTNETYCLISDLMDVVYVAGTVEQAEQPNYLAEGTLLLHLSCPPQAGLASHLGEPRRG
eukprot:1159232-Pelagomonas_calceolata.AAC.3